MCVFFCSVSIQQLTEFSPETYDAVTSMVAMAPGTVTVVQQVNSIATLTQEIINLCSKMLMLNCG